MPNSKTVILTTLLATSGVAHDAAAEEPHDVHSGQAVINLTDYSYTLDDLLGNPKEIGNAICTEVGHGVFQIRSEIGTVLSNPLYCFYPFGFNVNGIAYDLPPDPPMLDRENLEPLYEAVQDKNVVFFGEQHQKSDEEMLILDILPRLKEEGFTHIGLELDPLHQPGIDRFLSSEDSSEFRKIKEYHMNGSDKVRIIKKAKKLGLQIVCFDSTAKKDWEDWHKSSNGRSWWQEREYRMLGNLKPIIDQGVKIIVVVGSGHISLNTNQWFINGDTPVTLRPDLAHMVMDTIGRDKVLSVDLTGEKTSYVDFYISPETKQTN